MAISDVSPCVIMGVYFQIFIMLVFYTFTFEVNVLIVMHDQCQCYFAKISL